MSVVYGGYFAVVIDGGGIVYVWVLLLCCYFGAMLVSTFVYVVYGPGLVVSISRLDVCI